MPSLTTDRLTGRPIQDSDWPVIHAIQTDPETGYWVRGPDIEASEQRSRGIAARHAATWDSHGWGTYLWSLGGEPIGYAGLRQTRLEDTEEVEALWGVTAPHRRKGYALEAMQTALADPLTRSFRSIAAWTLSDNRASRGLMERLGFRYERDVLYADLPHVVYRLHR